MLESTGRAELIEIDLHRLDWYGAFYERHAPDGRIEAGRALMWTTVIRPWEVPGRATGHPLSEASYWELFLAGYARYRATGNVAPSDPYVTYLMGPFRDGDYDPGLSPVLASAGAVVDRVRRRYADMDRLAAADPAAGTLTVIDEVRLVASIERTADDFSVSVIGREYQLSVRAFDGYHRAFVAQLLGFASLACRAHVLEGDTAVSVSGGAT
jgi:hypothetical protein